jgi:hypothetical protein
MKIKFKEWAPWIAILRQYSAHDDLRKYIKTVVSDKEGRQFIGLVLACARWVYAAQGNPHLLVSCGLCAINPTCCQCILSKKRLPCRSLSMSYSRELCNDDYDPKAPGAKLLATKFRDLLLGLYAEEYKRMGL